MPLPDLRTRRRLVSTSSLYEINANWGTNRKHSQGLQALQRRQEDKACHKKFHPHRVALVKRQVMRKLGAQNTLKE
jgi:hypothetical protein